MIYKMLDISTAHYSKKTDEFLKDVVDDVQDFSLHVISTGTGVIVPATVDALDENDLDVMPECLMTVMEYAESKDCLYIRFDRDGEIIDDLPTWDW